MLRGLSFGRQCLTRNARHALVQAATTLRSTGASRKSQLLKPEPNGLLAPLGREVPHFTRLLASIEARHGLASSALKASPTESVEEQRVKKRASRNTKGKKKSAEEGDTLDAPRVDVNHSTSPNHHDLVSFLEHASRAGLKTTTAVYKGTLYEYLTAESLKEYNFTLKRSGRANDLGIDLIGTWNLPEEPSEVKVLLQCKSSKPSPSMVRELEGAYVGAPAGWRGEDVMGILVSAHPATGGVRASLQRSRLPLCFVQMDTSGNVVQFLWNTVAKDRRLSGMTVGSVYKAAAPTTGTRKNRARPVQQAISLLWLGKPWRGQIAAKPIEPEIVAAESGELSSSAAPA